MNVLAGLVFFLLANRAIAAPCSYETWDWNVVTKTSVNHRKVTKDSNSLDATEKGTIPGCTVCREDQTMIRIEGLPPFEVCRKFSESIQRAVEKAKTSGFKFQSIVGYRVGKSKGPIKNGLRTEFSNHSYGAAIDFNSETNALYDDCVEFSPKCRLLRGGRYDWKAPTAITRTSSIYREMTVEGFKWGGEITAKQKDFMHFSPTGM